jgi:hypothetical protein
VTHTREPGNRGRRRVHSEVCRQKEANSALMYQQLKLQSLCAEACWNQKTLLASITDIAAPIVPIPTHSNLPPLPASCFVPAVSIPSIQVNSSVLPNAVLTTIPC